MATIKSNATKCRKCHKPLGEITAGAPITENATVRYQHGSASVRWTNSRPVIYGHTCTACRDKVRDDAGRGPDHPDFGFPW